MTIVDPSDPESGSSRYWTADFKDLATARRDDVHSNAAEPPGRRVLAGDAAGSLIFFDRWPSISRRH